MIQLDIKCKKCGVCLTDDNWRASSKRDNRFACTGCLNLDYQKWAKANKENLKNKSSTYYYLNKEKRLLANRKYISQNREKVNLVKRKHTSKRKALLLNRMPSWANPDKLASFYSNCPPGYHVDHIIPLQGKNVSGLHVENNLQYLPATENLSKGNKYNVE